MEIPTILVLATLVLLLAAAFNQKPHIHHMLLGLAIAILLVLGAMLQMGNHITIH